jgi:hypothetical protein
MRSVEPRGPVCRRRVGSRGGRHAAARRHAGAGDDSTDGSRRLITIHLLQRYLGHPIRTVSARIAGRAAKVGRVDGRFSIRVDMRGRGRSTVSVDALVSLGDAHAVTVRRAYRTCRRQPAPR